eukprot:TRINITY_DN347_c0_g1_i2.p2 TRINITY_DN347_c0_g1~~TRINITY_DN347_c0_g1_i2.p2  ORF type:complete len:157 (-),score=62.16 TRINITY_DN347_c0_g1_i2:475-945(-)
MSEIEGGQQVDLGQLSLEQLGMVRKQLEEENQALMGAFTNLKEAQSRFRMAKETVAEFNEDNKDCEVLIPMTQSLYVPGKLNDVKHVLVEVGTGYFVKKTTEGADDYLQGRLNTVENTLSNLEKTIQLKQQYYSMAAQAQQAKVQQQMQAQQQPSG